MVTLVSAWVVGGSWLLTDVFVQVPHLQAGPSVLNRSRGSVCQVLESENTMRRRKGGSKQFTVWKFGGPKHSRLCVIKAVRSSVILLSSIWSSSAPHSAMEVQTCQAARRPSRGFLNQQRSSSPSSFSPTASRSQVSASDTGNSVAPNHPATAERSKTWKVFSPLEASAQCFADAKGIHPHNGQILRLARCVHCNPPCHRDQRRSQDRPIRGPACHSQHQGMSTFEQIVAVLRTFLSCLRFCMRHAARDGKDFRARTSTISVLFERKMISMTRACAWWFWAMFGNTTLKLLFFVHRHRRPSSPSFPPCLSPIVNRAIVILPFGC